MPSFVFEQGNGERKAIISFVSVGVHLSICLSVHLSVCLIACLSLSCLYLPDLFHLTL